MNRRDFLKGSIILPFIFSADCGKGEESGEIRYIRACEAFIPIDKVDIDEGALRIAYRNIVEKLSPSNRDLFDWAMWGLDVFPLFYGRFRTFKNLSVDERRRILRRMERGGLIASGLFFIVKQFVLIGFVMNEGFRKKVGWEEVCE